MSQILSIMKSDDRSILSPL